MRITDVRFTSANSVQAEKGLLGWVSCTLNSSIRLSSIALRRTSDGRFALSFPARKDSGGNKHSYIRPLDDETRRDIERQIFTALGLGEEPTLSPSEFEDNKEAGGSS